MTQTTPTKEQLNEWKSLAERWTPFNPDHCTDAPGKNLHALALYANYLAAQLAALDKENDELAEAANTETRRAEIAGKRQQQAEAAAASARETALDDALHICANEQDVYGIALGIADRIRALKSTPAPVTPSAPAEADGWKLVETAPRDGTHIMVPSQFTGMEIDEAVYDHDAPNGGGWWSVKLEIPVEPKVWRPLPSPPTAREGRG